MLLQNLRFYRQNQGKFHCAAHEDVEDLHAKGEEGELLSKHVILQSCEPGSDREMSQLPQDSLAIRRKFYNPGAFITITCNPDWLEVHETLQNPKQAGWE